MGNKSFHIITMSTYGTGLSGGDRIWIELSKKIAAKYPIHIYLWEEGRMIARREGLNINFVLWSAKKWAEFGFFINYFARIFIAIFKALLLKLDNTPETILYSASEFWQDSLPAVILKLRFSKIRWIAAWYQTAPNPFFGYNEGDEGARYRFRSFLYWLVQQPIKPLIKRWANIVIINNENEKKEFSSKTEKNEVVVMLGAIDIEKIKNYQSNHKNPAKIYDGVFQGRFHPQKGVVELIDIWRIVTLSKPDAKLALIGDGPLMDEVKKRIKEFNLEESIQLFGYLFDGPEKYRVFSQSKVVLHPAFYDSGGMASAEGMAFGLPVVGFDLVSYKSYYPKGMVKVKIGNLEQFAKLVLKLLNNAKLRNQVAKEGADMLEENWSWDKRLESLLNHL